MNRKNKISVLLFLLVLFFAFISNAQDSIYARKVIQTLTSDKYYGRGYVKNGDGKAASYIEGEFRRLNLEPLTGSYFQKFEFAVNTFPSTMKIYIDGKALIPGRDYIVYPSSSSCNKEFTITEADSASMLQNLKKESEDCLFISNKYFNASREEANDALALRRQGAVVLVEENKLTWSVGRSQLHIPVIIILKKSLPDHFTKINFKIKSVFQPEHKTQNVIGYIKGKSLPDSFLVFSAHYDHLGMMGKKTIFPGANDNASGVAMLLNLAAHFTNPENRTECSLVFIAFAGEEAGLVGSHYYTENPLFSLSKIKFLINLDLLGTGDEGLTVVNATEYKSQFQLLKSINENNKYLPFIGERGKARNSDHYFFSEKGVPCFFLYTLGGIKAYHDIDDKSTTLPLTRFKEVFRLIRDFSNSLN
ncbi:MAG: M28 family peptidase [Bacteroidota bacterium]